MDDRIAQMSEDAGPPHGADPRSGVPFSGDEGCFTRVIGLASGVADPVAIIQAAQIRLRRLRRLAGPPRRASARIQRVREARDRLIGGRFAGGRDAFRGTRE